MHVVAGSSSNEIDRTSECIPALQYLCHCMLPTGLHRIHHHYHHHLSLNREGRWDTTDDFATSFLHFSLFGMVWLLVVIAW